MPKEQLKSPQKGDDMTNPTLAGCKLTCVPDGNLWPKPRGDVSVSKTLVRFQLSDISVNKISAPSSKVICNTLNFFYEITKLSYGNIDFRLEH